MSVVVEKPRGRRKQPQDTARANRFIRWFGEWYLGVYGRPHAPASGQQVFQVCDLLRKAERCVAMVPQFDGDTAEIVIESALGVAVRNRYEIWFLNKGDSLMLGTLIGNWQKLWDRLCEAAQDKGHIPRVAEGVAR